MTGMEQEYLQYVHYRKYAYMTIKVKNCSVASTTWDLMSLKMFFKIFFAFRFQSKYLSSTLYDYQFSNKRPKRMQHISEQYIVSKRINTGNIWTLCHFDYNRHHQFESICLEQKTYVISCLYYWQYPQIDFLHHLWMNFCWGNEFWCKQKSYNLSDTTLSINTCSICFHHEANDKRMTSGKQLT